MQLQISVDLGYVVERPCDLLLQIEAASSVTQTVIDAHLSLSGSNKETRIVAEEGIGTRIWVQANTHFECRYEASVEVSRPQVDLGDMRQTPLSNIPADVVKYLMPSRYCFLEVVPRILVVEAPDLKGGELVEAINNWIYNNFTYDPTNSNTDTTAADSLRTMTGVCRDYAHVLIAMARFSGIPARMVSCYAPNVTPQDFHAVVEVYLNYAWYLVDPTRMASAKDIAIIGVGQDASDISLITSFGLLELKHMCVQVLSK